jgi:hypothetical protein
MIAARHSVSPNCACGQLARPICQQVRLASSVVAAHGNMNATTANRAENERGPSVSKVDRKNGVPSTLTTIPLTDPHARPAEPSIGDLIKDATTQMSTLVRAEVELARAEITRDLKKGLTGSVFFIAAIVIFFYSTFFFFFALAELLDTWIWRWVAFGIVFVMMAGFGILLALFGFLKVRRIRGPQQTIESVKEARTALTPGHDKTGDGARKAITSDGTQAAPKPADPTGW